MKSEAINYKGLHIIESKSFQSQGLACYRKWKWSFYMENKVKVIKYQGYIENESDRLWTC